MKISKNIKLDSFTTLGVGGEASFFVEAGSKSEVVDALEFAREKDLEVFVLGRGSNVLISDEGFKGLIVKIEEITNVKYFGVQSSYGEKQGIALHIKINSADGETFTQWFSLVKDARGLKQSNIWAFRQKYGQFPDVGLEVDVNLNENGFYEVVY